MAVRLDVRASRGWTVSMDARDLVVSPALPVLTDYLTERDVQVHQV